MERKSRLNGDIDGGGGGGATPTNNTSPTPRPLYRYRPLIRRQLVCIGTTGDATAKQKKNAEKAPTISIRSFTAFAF